MLTVVGFIIITGVFLYSFCFVCVFYGGYVPGSFATNHNVAL